MLYWGSVLFSSTNGKRRTNQITQERTPCEFMHTWYKSAHSTGNRFTQVIHLGAWDLPFPRGRILMATLPNLDRKTSPTYLWAKFWK